MPQLFDLVCLICIVFGCLLTTFVFCFWFIYLLDAVIRKWKFYRNALRCLQQENFDSQQQALAYNAKTEFVKNVFLFFMNLLEWLALISICISFIIHFARIEEIDCQKVDSLNNTSNFDFMMKVSCTLTEIVTFQFHFLINLLVSLGIGCSMLSVILIASLCRYLASRYSQYSWISSSRAPISLLILYQIICLIAFFYSLLIFAKCLELLLFTASILIALKQYRKLLMVINWTIVDMRVSGNTLLLKKQIEMKRTFTRMSSLVWLGIITVLVSQYIDFFHFSSLFLIRSSYFHGFESLHLHTARIIIIKMYDLNKFVLLIGILLIYIQYVGLGLSTLSVILWRLYTGKSGYRTHFHNDLYAPLV